MDDLYFSLYKWQFYDHYLLHSTFEYEHGVVLGKNTGSEVHFLQVSGFYQKQIVHILEMGDLLYLLFLSILETSISEGNMQAVGATQKELVLSLEVTSLSSQILEKHNQNAKLKDRKTHVRI